MDKKNVEEVKASLLEINQIISKLDSSIRVAAFQILAPCYFSQMQTSIDQSTIAKNSAGFREGADNSDNHDLGAFISTFDNGKPKDNVLLIVAWLYSNYGVYPITAKEIQELGDSCGLIIPNRSDNTMRQAKNNGKNLFNQQGKGWQPTVSGEIFFKETFKVKKGNKPIPKE